MATDSRTPTLDLVKPVVGDEAGEDLWGEKVNANFDKLDTFALDTNAALAGITAPTWDEVTGKPTTFPPAAHTHTIGDVDDLQAELDLKLEDAPSNGSQYARQDGAWTVVVAPDPSIDWTEITGKPTTFPPSSHTHLQSEVTDLVTDLAAKAPLASPVFTGNPTAPTPTAGDNDTSLATTAFVTTAVAAVGGGISEAPVDSQQYARKNAAWAVVTAPPAVAGDPYWSNVVLLAGFNGTNGATAFTDESGYARVATFNGNAQISTTQSKFGGSSAKFDGSGDQITFPDSTDWDWGTGPFTVELWVYWVSGNAHFIGQWGFGADATWVLQMNSTTLQGMVMAAAASAQSTGVLVANTWTHLCFERDNNGKLRIYHNGVCTGSTATYASAISGSTQPMALGKQTNGIGDLNGYIDEVRVTKGVARYATDATFPLPTAAFPRVASSAITEPPFDNGEYVRINGIWRLKSQTFSWSGSTPLSIAVPSGVRAMRYQVSGEASSTTAWSVAMRVSADGTTFLTGATDYNSAGMIHYTGSGGYANYPPAAAAYFPLSSSNDVVGYATLVDGFFNLYRSSTSLLFTGANKGLSYASAAANNHIAFDTRTFLSSAASTSLVLKAVQFYPTANSLANGSYVDIEWLY